jgi:uncharacterized membrane protein YhaH (DUF805 family)
MGVCDVCNKDLGEKEGYLLTTLDVVTTPAYWKKSMSTMTSMFGMSDDSTRAYLAEMMASQKLPWMICNDCIKIFNVDKVKTRKYAIQWYESGGTFQPPGTGAVPLSKVNMGDGKVYIKGGSPEALQIANSLKSKGKSTGGQAKESGSDKLSGQTEQSASRGSESIDDILGHPYKPEKTVGQKADLKAMLFSFQGRLSRSDYWKKAFPVLFIFGFTIGLIQAAENRSSGQPVVSVLLYLVFLWPFLAVAAKRLHDINRSGSLLWTWIIPFVNIIFMVWLGILIWFYKGTEGSNRFGPDPCQ